MATIVDLRGTDPGGPWHPPELARKVIVLDDAGELVTHAEIYLTLLGDPAVDKVICIAIGEAGQANPSDGVALTVPPALRHEAVLWVGDVQGLDWAPVAAPRRRRRPTDSLGELITILDVEKVFERVWEAIQEMPGRAASPGILPAFGPVEPAALADASAAAIRELCTARQAASRTLSEAAILLDAPHDLPRASFSGPLDKAAKEARKRLDRVGELVRALGGWHDPAGPTRTAAMLGTEVVRAGQSAENYRRYVAELLNRMDGHLQRGRPPEDEVMELGVPEPAQARGAEIASGLRQLVAARLDAGVPLPTLTEELRLTAAYTKPQGVGAALNELRRLDPIQLELPAFARWPLPRAVLPVVLLTCLAMVLLSGPGTDGLILASVLALLWFGTGWLMLANRPEPYGRRGFGASLPAAAATYGLAGALGVVAGAASAELIPGAPRVPYPLVLFAMVALVTLVLGGAFWGAAVRRWPLALGAVTDAVDKLEQMATRALRIEWLPMRRRRLIAAAAAAAAVESDAMRETLGEARDGLFTTRRSHVDRPASGSAVQPAPQELFAIVRGDLVRLCHRALDPLWPAIEAGRPPEVHDHDRLKDLLADYDTGVTEKGLMWMPDGGESEPRTALMERVAGLLAVRQALNTQPSDEMRQLCDSRQLGYLSGSVPPSVVRYAPLLLQRVLDEHSADRSIVDDPGIEWSVGSELIGALRLVPLRAESVRRGWGEF